MTGLAVTRCARPVVRTTSTYTVLGFAGYGVASLVAAALFISPKTVEANLGRIYRKLGINSRAELGRLIGDS